jgi:hypothetical protein
VALPEDDPDAVVFEVWHVRLLSLSPLAVQSRVSRTLLTPCLLGNMEIPRIPRISPADAAVHSALHRGWLLHQRGGRFMGVCRSVCSSVPLFHNVLMRIDTKSANGGRHLSGRPIISLDTPPCTPSTASQTRSAFD